MINTPSFEIEPLPTTPASPDSLGKRPKKQIAPCTNCFQFVDLDVFAKSRDKPPGPARPYLQKTIQQYDQYG